MKKPAPKHTQTVCTVCNLDWKAHEDAAKAAKRKNPSLDDCVKLLLAEVGRLRMPRSLIYQGTGVTAAPLTASYSGVPLPGSLMGKAS